MRSEEPEQIAGVKRCGRRWRPLAYCHGWTPRHSATSPTLWAAPFTTLDASFRLQGRVWLRPTTRFAGCGFHVPLTLCNMATLAPPLRLTGPFLFVPIRQGTRPGNPSFWGAPERRPKSGLSGLSFASSLPDAPGQAPHATIRHWGALNRLGPIFVTRLPPALRRSRWA